MNKNIAVTLLLSAVACKKPDDDVAEQLQRLNGRLDAQEKKLDQVLQLLRARGGGQPQQPQQPPEPEPDPNLTYSVPIDGDVVRGPATAKITVVEAADFA